MYRGTSDDHSRPHCLDQGCAPQRVGMSETGPQSGHGRLLERQVNAILRGVVLDASSLRLDLKGQAKDGQNEAEQF
jgi:hypothetical protein